VDPVLSAKAGALRAILQDIERSVPKDFRNLEELRAFLGRSALAPVVGHWTVDGQPVIEAERHAFTAYVAGLNDASLLRIPRIPYRRVLSESQRNRVTADVHRRWGFVWRGRGPNVFSHPYPPEALPADAVAFGLRYFRVRFGPEKLAAILMQRRAITRVFEISEVDLVAAYEMDPQLCSFHTIPDCCWTSRDGDWLVYGSHELAS
jgi:hypothetical protein